MEEGAPGTGASADAGTAGADSPVGHGWFGTAIIVLLCVFAVAAVLALVGDGMRTAAAARSRTVEVLSVRNDSVTVRGPGDGAVAFRIGADDLPETGRSSIRTGDTILNPYFDDHGLVPDGSLPEGRVDGVGTRCPECGACVGRE